LQVRLCDLCLSAVSVRYYKKSAMYIHLPIFFIGTEQRQNFFL